MAAFTKYTNVIPVTVGAGATLSFAHGLRTEERVGLIPNMVVPDRDSPLVVVGVDDVSISVNNPSAAPATANFLCQLDFSTQRDPDALDAFYWQGGGGGGGGLAPYEYVVQPGAPNAGTYATIPLAVAAAAADGASNNNPKIVYVEGGLYTGQIINLSDGITLMGAPSPFGFAGFGALGGPLLQDCVITVANNAWASMGGFNVQRTALSSAPLTVGAGALFSLTNCSVTADDTGFPFDLIQNAGSLWVRDSLVQNFDGITINHNGLGVLRIYGSDIIGNNNGGPAAIFLNAPGGGQNQALIYDSSIVGISGTALATGGGVGPQAVLCQMLRCFVEQFDGFGHGIDISVNGFLVVQDILFTVVDGGANRAINGVAGASLHWGGLNFAPFEPFTLAPCTNRVATTTIGAGALPMPVDIITAV